MAVTRIKNNQITDATITAAKIASQTLVGSLFATDLTLNSNLSIIGNLTITGTSSNINAINTFISDPFVIFNNGYTGSLTNYTIGMLLNRNLSSLAAYGGVNTAWVWSEADGAFTGIATTDTGTGIVSINNAGYANIKIGNLQAVAAISASSISATTLNFTNAVASTLVATNFSSGNVVITGGSFNNGPIGNTSASTGRFTTIVSTGTTTSAGNLVANSGTASSSTTTGALVVVGGAGISGAVYAGSLQATPIGSSSASTGAFTTLTSSSTITASGNIVAASGTASTNTTTGALVVVGGAGISGAIYAGSIQATPVGSSSASTGAFTTLTSSSTFTSSGNIVAASGTASTNTTTGALVVIGGAGISGAIYAGSLQATPVGSSSASTGAFTTLSSNGLTTFTNATQSDNASSGAVVVTGGLGVGANLNVAGNVTVTGNLLVLGNTTTLNVETLNVEDLNITVAANATSGAEANGAGLTVAGANATLTYLNADDSWNLNKKLNATTVGAAQINITNANITNAAVSTLVATNYSSANTVITGGSVNNSPIGNTTPSTGSFTTLTTTGRITSGGNIVAASGVNATNFTTGALVVPGGGGVGITGDLQVQGQSTFQGNINAGNIILSGNINVSVGAVQSSFGVFYGNAGGIGALYAGTSTYTALPTTVLQMTADVNTYAQVNFQNRNSGANASTDFVLTADNGDDNDGYINLGINSSTFSDPAFAGYYPDDGYLIMHGLEPSTGNLNIHSHNSGSVIKFIVGAFGDANVKTTVTSTGFRVNTSTASTSTTTGALLVDGGAGIAGNINVGLGAVFNATKTANYDFIVRGDNDDTLIWARPGSAYDSVVIGNNATTSTLVTGAKLIVNTTDSILIPAGTTAQRPGSSGGTDTAGMIRFNTSNAQLEFYNGSSWTNTGTSFTVIASDTFDGDDNTTIFTLGASATTQSVIVSLNGVLQIPTLAYSVSGATLTFTSAPATGDKIEVRRLTTTATVSTFESSNGYVSFTATNSFANINAGTGSATTRMSFNTTGNVSVTANVQPSANVAYDLGNVNSWWKNVFTSKTVTTGADIAENYLADAVYNPGTVVEFGGEAEVTVSMTEGSTRIAGVITSEPGHVMNGGLKGSTVVSVALLGRVPVNVIGPVYKGDMLISAGYGFARACASPVLGSVIGKALANFEGEKGSVEVVVGRS